MEKGGLWATVHGVAELDTTEHAHVPCNKSRKALPSYKGKDQLPVGDQKTRKEGDENGRSEIKGERQILSCSWLAR